jgi:haloacid dehalogenase superfamily, subfamily IA, variant 1 with third motif having Dx(3-4)D or Dx(3-4)E
MEEPTRIILWDFDGTLAYKPGLWSGTLMKVLDMHVPNHNIDISQIKPYLQEGFPWHKSDEPHHHLSTPESWWLHVEGVIANAYQAVGVSHELSGPLARLVHQHYIDSQSFILFDDTISTLRHLSVQGWENVILSNHVPELPQIVEQLGLDQLIVDCISSAAIGYEKPHSEAFKIALSGFSNVSSVWMVGDSLKADILGAQEMNIPAILVHSTHSENVKIFCSYVERCY